MEQQTQTVKLELSINQLNVVMAGIVKLPIEVGLEIFNEIQKQAQQQLGTPTSAEAPLSKKVI